jgi:7,8-dihydropterin-6-yl-methyl-4-(beta-D-ribofuranosyl)aminobenzene 5'-phosphate synthase
MINMKLTIVYDNTVFKKNIGLKPDWGFSCLIETDSDVILFDTGTKGKILLDNMEKLDIDPSDIKKIVISHEHYDHNGGLIDLLSVLDHVEVFRLAGKTNAENVTHRTIFEPCKISKNVHTTGCLRGSPVDEQSLVLHGKDGWYVLVGCSHSGVNNILSEARRHGKLVGLIGGLHGFDDFQVLKDLEFIIPCHCTRYIKEIRSLYPDKSETGGVGKIITI